MAHLIDKDALVAEIESYKNSVGEDGEHCSLVVGKHKGQKMASEHFLSFIDTLEVKEVNFETAFATMIDVFDEKCGPHWCEEDLKEFAKHFFELGLKAKQG